MISVDFNAPEPFAVGQEVRGVVTWIPQEAARAHSLVVTIGWRAEPQTESLEVHIDKLTFVTLQHPFAGELPTKVEVPFQLELPAEGPVSYQGILLRISWAVHVRIQTINITLNTDRIESFPFVVGPRLLGP